MSRRLVDADDAANWRKVGESLTRLAQVAFAGEGNQVYRHAQRLARHEDLQPDDAAFDLEKRASKDDVTVKIMPNWAAFDDLKCIDFVVEIDCPHYSLLASIRFIAAPEAEKWLRRKWQILNWVGADPGTVLEALYDLAEDPPIFS